MQLFIGNLNKYDNAAGLLERFKPLRHDIRIQILKLSNKYTTMYHGLVTVRSERNAQRSIKLLNNTLFHDRYITVREYTHRASSNDRRAINWRDKNWDNFNRRSQERRNNWKVSVVDEFDSYKTRLSLATRLQSLKLSVERLPGLAKRGLQHLMSSRR